MKFDGNLAWKQATATMAGNKELLFALAGVFFFLPNFALVMLFKLPQIPANGTPEQMMAVIQPFFAAMMPWFVISSLVQSLGQLTLAELLGRGGQVTVGEALRKGAGGLLTFIAVQLMGGFMMSSVSFFGLLAGSLVTPVLGLILAAYLFCQVYARFMTACVVIVLERQRNPIAVLVRAATLARGNGFRVGHFLLLLVAAFFLAFAVFTIIIGIITALTIGEGHAADILAGFVSSAITAVGLAYFVAIQVAVYRQLAGIAKSSGSTPPPTA